MIGIDTGLIWQKTDRQKKSRPIFADPLDDPLEFWHQRGVTFRMHIGQILESFSEADLLARVARQDSEAFGCFYDRTAGVLFSVAQSILRDPSLSEDVLQEVYLQIWEKAEVFNPALGKPIAWCIALTRNKALDRLRSTTRRDAAMQEFRDLGEPDSASSEAALLNLELKEAAALVKTAMNSLPEKQRRAIELALLIGHPHGEVAELMQEPLGTVKAWIRRGMIDIREQIKNHL
jgi:RNA polymerase sigma-70 factor (ECF subfamily)